MHSGMGTPTSPDAADLAPTDSAPGPWLDGYLWMRAGRYDLAWSAWERRPSDARVHVSRGATCRELGLHERAEEHDLAAAASAEAPITAAATVGLVADAVGRSEPYEAASRLERARQEVCNLDRSPVADRQHIRLGWVEVEVALLTGAQPDSPLPRFTASGGIDAPPTYRTGTRHHLAKGLMFAGVVDGDLGTLEHAATLAPSGWRWAIHLARVDLGASGAREEARSAWAEVVPPGPLAAEAMRIARERGLVAAP